MLKKSSLRRIAIATCALLIVLILYAFPTKDANYKTQKEYTQEYKKTNIFLIDENNYVAMTNIPSDDSDTLKKAQDILETLTIDSNKSTYIPNGFKAIIPKNTKILDISIKDNLIKVDFSNNILKVKKADEEKMIESIVYSLTSLDEIKKVMIFIEGEILQELPNSKKQLPTTLDRSYGINKVYDLSDYKNITKTTVYYISKYDELYYYVPVTKIDNNTEDKVKVIINELKSNPIYQTNLMSYLKANAQLEDYEIKENTISLSFNEYLFNDLEKKDILEEVKYSISLSLKDNLDIEEVLFIVKNEQIDKLALKNVSIT